MKAAAVIRIALRALRRNKLRTALTMLGIIIGVGAVIAMVGIGNGAKAQVEAQIASLGENVILIFSGSRTSGGIRSGWGSSGTLKIEDAEAISREISGVVAVSPEIRSSDQVASGNQNWFTQILGEAPDYFSIRQWAFKEGGSFGEQDVRGANKVCVIGQTTARQLFGDASPLGEIIRIKQVPFVIVGVLAPKGMSVMGSDQDDVVVMPYTSAMKRVLGQTTLRSINVQAESAQSVAGVQQQIISLLRQKHRITGEDDFTVRSQEEIAEAATATSRVLTMSPRHSRSAASEESWALPSAWALPKYFPASPAGPPPYQPPRSPWPSDSAPRSESSSATIPRERPRPSIRSMPFATSSLRAFRSPGAHDISRSPAPPGARLRNPHKFCDESPPLHLQLQIAGRRCGGVRIPPGRELREEFQKGQKRNSGPPPQGQASTADGSFSARREANPHHLEEAFSTRSACASTTHRCSKKVSFPAAVHADCVHSVTPPCAGSETAPLGSALK
jgi:hypothetical protein